MLIFAWDRDKARHRNEFDLSSAIHEAEKENVRKTAEPAHRFEVSLELDGYTQEKYQLFKNYQKHVHHDDDVSWNGFRRFLCDSPLSRTTRMINGVEQKLGSYHHCYRLDGRLIAMGVLDLLPHCVSSVYLIYHSDFEKWSFGKLSALREAALALEAGYRFYYMGYYIHSCAKMRYKNDYHPQYVLDYETNAWYPLDDGVKALLSRQKYVSMSRELRLGAAKAPSSNGDSPDQHHNEEDCAGATLPTDLSPQEAAAPYTTPLEAAAAYASGTSLFKLGLPGMLTLAETEAAVDLGGVKISLRGKIYVAEVRPAISVLYLFAFCANTGPWRCSLAGIRTTPLTRSRSREVLRRWRPALVRRLRRERSWCLAVARRKRSGWVRAAA